MVRNRDPFATALNSLRTRLADGVYAPGAPIVIFDEARRLRLSTTPVREALAWLSGSGLVEHSATGGYRALSLEVGGVRDDYAFRAACLRMSLERAGASPIGDVPAGGASALFQWMVGRCGDAALSRAYRAVDLHLDRLARAERRILGDPATALEEMRAALRQGRPDDVAEHIAAYHHQRIVAAAALVFEAAQPPPVGPD
ncbi:GntR family transcriptional regulator [Brevundimonas sp.]|uniref:GntR family transcriptional regulator n=1 Tax=Brevundimonas sp. TaxID=1871086 RepID=UPI0019962617|nr:GntR family transcriptional regulator [Brevundimonas sp.]MBD3836808.1 GntR family transcriptional regulator [Brevundimonas sp.]